MLVSQIIGLPQQASKAGRGGGGGGGIESNKWWVDRGGVERAGREKWLKKRSSEPMEGRIETSSLLSFTLTGFIH